jgi:hypothetical protein
VPEDERRCPNCGALVTVDATWCGQCFASLVGPEAAPVPEHAATPAVGEAPARAGERAAFWPCPVCGGHNPIDADPCVTCGTPFAAAMRSEPDRPVVEPKDAVAWSLLYPGLGHRKVGRATDGLARGVLFGLSFGMAVLIGLGGVRSGPAFGVFLLLLLSGLSVYVLSAIESYRLATGGDVLVPSRMLMWLLVGVIFLTVMLLAIAVVTATRR